VQDKLNMILNKMQQAVLFLLLCFADGTAVLKQQLSSLDEHVAEMLRDSLAAEASALREHMSAMRDVMQQIADKDCSDAAVQRSMQALSDSMLELSERAVQLVGDACTTMQQEVGGQLEDIDGHVQRLQINFELFGRTLHKIGGDVKDVKAMLKEVFCATLCPSQCLCTGGCLQQYSECSSCCLRSPSSITPFGSSRFPSSTCHEDESQWHARNPVRPGFRIAS
jgi:archaellum component FlaC